MQISRQKPAEATSRRQFQFIEPVYKDMLKKNPVAMRRYKAEREFFYEIPTKKKEKNVR